MTTQGVSLRIEPAELLRRLPRREGTFLLDGGSALSWGSGEALLGCEPTCVVRVYGSGEVEIASGGNVRRSCEDPLLLLDRLAERPEGDDAAEGPSGGLLCALGYDLGRWIERLPSAPEDDLGLPLVFAAVHPWVLRYSYCDRRYTLRSRQLSAAELREVAQRIEEAGSSASAEPVQLSRREVRSNFTVECYLRIVRRALEYIAAGDIYQVNLAQRFTVPLQEPPAALFTRLLRQHPMPYAAYVDCGDTALVSGSPECFLRRDGERLSTFPIKGTRPRGKTPEQDARMCAELAASAKDRAEHLMIVDLERNDLGRVCECGTIAAPMRATVRSFSTLHHLESEVSGILRPGTSWSDILRATFPGGSITGAPKIRAMEIIDELEPVARRFYTGAIGLVDGSDWARFNVAIRTAVATESGVAYHSGGGIVADSRPDEEYAETVLKARAFLDALHGELR